MADGAYHVPSRSLARTKPDPAGKDTPKTTLPARTNANPTAF